jgi:hypothetical protein
MSFLLVDGDVFLEEDGEPGSFNFCVPPEVPPGVLEVVELGVTSDITESLLTSFFTFLAKYPIFLLPNAIKAVGNPPEGPALGVFMVESVSLASCIVSVDGDIDNL